MTKKTKKLIAIVVSAVLLLACAIIPAVIYSGEGEDDFTATPTEETFDEWDGTVGAVPTDYDEDGIIEISSAEGFAALIKQGGKKGAVYRLTKDLIMNTAPFDTVTGKANGKLNSWFTENDVKRFSGSFDGDGHTVTGLYFAAKEQNNSANSPAVALFPALDSGAEIKNIGLEKSYIAAESVAAGIVGRISGAADTKLNTCYVADTVTLSGYQVGGILGLADTVADIRNTYALARLKSPETSETIGGIFGVSTADVNCENVYTSGAKLGGSGNVTGNDWYNGVASPSDVTVWNLGDAFYYPQKEYPALKYFSDNERSGLDVWSGTVSTPDDGTGTAEDPLIVSSAAELYYIVSNGEMNTASVDTELHSVDGKFVKLTKDIIVNDVNVQIESGKGVIYGADGLKLGNSNSLREWFTNRQKVASNITIDGDGHIIRGIYLDEESADTSNYHDNGIGLINKGNNITLKNIGIQDMWATHKNGSVAAFIGNIHQQSGNIIENCFVDEDVYISGAGAAAIFGSGDQLGCTQTVKNCYVLAMISGAKSYGAVAAYAWNTAGCSVSDFYTTSRLFGSEAMNTVRAYGEITPYVAFGSVTDGNTLCLSNEFHYVENDYPALRKFTGYSNTWNGLGDSSFGGYGTVYSPYVVRNAGQLAYIISNFGRDSGYYVQLANDIAVNDLDKINWKTGVPEEGYTPIRWFSGENTNGNSYIGNGGKESSWRGNLNGNGHTVSGIWYPSDTTSTASGLIPSATDAAITNLTVDDSYIVSDRYAGVFVAWSEGATGTVQISGVRAGENALLKSSSLYTKHDTKGFGGIVGYMTNNGALNNCIFEGKIVESRISPAYLQGLIGNYWSANITVNGCYSLGYSPSRQSDSSHSGKITVTGSYYDTAHKDAKTDSQYTKITTDELKTQIQ